MECEEQHHGDADDDRVRAEEIPEAPREVTVGVDRRPVKERREPDSPQI